MNIVAYYIHNIDPFIIKFCNNCKIGGIRWYGVCYVIAFIFAIFMLNLYSKKGVSKLTCEQNSTFMSYAIAGVIIGGRLGYILLYTPEIIVSRPLEIFAVWHGGMSSHGGFIGVLISTIIFCRKFHINLLSMTDMCATVAPFGFFIGRIANFINGELYGKVTDVTWAVIFPNSAASIDFAQPRHPSQLYECALEGLILLIYMQIRFWASKTSKGERSNCDAKNSNEKTKFSYIDGILTSEFLILYGIFRIFVEIFREPDADLICGMSRGQFYSIFLIFIGIALRIFLIKKQKNLLHISEIHSHDQI